jgi:hypothetical protein
VTPNFTSRKRYVIQSMIASDPMMIRRIAWPMRSPDTTAPTVVSDSCSAMGPNSCCRAVATSPIRPVVGTVVLPSGGAADGEADGEAPGLPDGPAEGLAPAEAGALAEADGDAAADGDGAAPPDGLGPGDPLAPGEPDGAVDG